MAEFLSVLCIAHVIMAWVTILLRCDDNVIILCAAAGVGYK